MTFREAVDRLGIERVCLGGCGLSPRAHRGTIFLGVIHFAERRFTRRGLRNLLLLAARRDREGVPLLGDESPPIRGFLNDARSYGWLYAYLDERKANEWAAQLDLRFPIAYSRSDRLRSFLLLPPGTARHHSAVWAWARRGWQ